MQAKYKKNFLKKVVLRVDFASPISIEGELEKEISKVVLKNFPILEPKQMTEGVIKIDKAGIGGTTKNSTVWNYFGKDRDKTLAVGEKFMFIEYDKYMGFDKTSEEFIEVLKTFFAKIENLNISRFGVRYINNIEIDEKEPTKWNKYINKKLLGVFDIVSEENEKMSRGFSILSTVLDEFNFTFQYGMHNPDYPAQIKKKIFVLDFDAFSHGLQNENEIKEKMKKMHQHIRKYFDYSITANLEKIMGYAE